MGKVTAEGEVVFANATHRSAEALIKSFRETEVDCPFDSRRNLGGNPPGGFNSPSDEVDAGR